MKRKPTTARGARAKTKKTTAKPKARRKKTPEEIFDEQGMSPFYDIHLRTAAGSARKLDLSNKQHRITFEAACRMKATTQEITHLFGLSNETVLKSAVRKHYGKAFLEVYTMKSAEGVISLRRAQWMSAVQDRNVSMMIWLGKQYLGQKDRFDLEIPGEETGEAVQFYIPAIARPAQIGKPKPNPEKGLHVAEK